MNNSNILIDLISLDEWPKYKALRLESLQSDSNAFLTRYEDELQSPDEKWQTRLAKAIEGNGALILFAIEGSNLVGMAGSYWDTNTISDTAMIVSVYVSKDHIGKGIGSRLMNELLSKIAELSKFKKLKLEVNSAQKAAVKLYEKFGFKKTDSQRMILGDGNEYEVITMEKEL